MDEQQGPVVNGKVELNAEFMEAFLRSQQSNLNPVAKLLGSYYVDLCKHGAETHLAATLTVKMQDWLLSCWGMEATVKRQLDEIKTATAELKKAVDNYNKMRGEIADGQ